MPLWEYERRSRRQRRGRGDFLRSAQTSGFNQLVRDSLITRGMDPDVMGNLGAPSTVTKPVDRETVRQVVPEGSVKSAQRAVKPDVPLSPEDKRVQQARYYVGQMVRKYYPGKEEEVQYVEAAGGQGFFLTHDGASRYFSSKRIPAPSETVMETQAEIGISAGPAIVSTIAKVPGLLGLGGGDEEEAYVEGQEVKLAPTRVGVLQPIAHILEPLDIPRQKVGKPLARALLEPLALAADAANALSPDNIAGVPSIRGITRPLLTGGEIRGATSVEILSYITDPLNAALFAGPIIRAAKSATLSARLSLKESQLLRKAIPRARSLMVEEAGGRAPKATAKATRIQPTTKLTKPVPVKESAEVKALRTKVTGEGRNPPPPPPPRLPGEPAGLLPGGQSPSMSLWRTIESGLFLSPRASNLMRRTAEMIGDAPAIRLFMKALTGPAALGRIISEIRAGVVYRRLQGVMEAELGQRLIGSEESFFRAFTVGKDRSSVVIAGKEVAFGDFASDVLLSGRIGAPRARFPVTVAQREWITSQKALIDDIARQYEHISGEKLRLLGDDYWPRFVIGDDGRVTIKGRVGAKQSPVKDRKLLEMEESIARGTPYASPIETVQLYGRAMQKMSRDKLLIQVIKEDKIGRPVITQLRQEIKAIKAKIKSAAPTTTDELSEVQVLRNKVGNLQAIVASKKRALIPAKQVLGPGFGKQMLEPEAAKVMQDIIGPGLGGKVGKGLRAATWLASVPRFIVTGAMDVGQFFIQGATLLATDPKSWSRAVGHSLTSLFLPEHWSRYLKNSPEAIEAAKYGIGRGGIEFLEITKRSAALGRLPGAKAIATVFGAAPRSFETFIEGSRIFNFNSLARIQRGAVGKAPRGILPTTGRAAAGISEAELEGELFRIANYVKTKLGTTDLMGLGLATTQRQVESAFLLYSPRYTRSVFGMLGWAMSNGVPARDAQRALGTMLFGGLASFYGFARAVGLDHDEAIKRINPGLPFLPRGTRGQFMSLPFGGNEYGFGSAYRASLGFLGSLIREDSWDFGSWEEASLDNPLAQYLRSRTAPTTGTLIDFIEGEDFMGKEVDLNAFIDDPSRILDYATGKFLPLNLEALFEARGPLEMRILAGLTETVGGRSFPRSAFSLFEEARENVFQEKRSLGEEPYIDFDSFEDLAKENAPATAVIDTDSRVQNAQERLEHESRFRKKTREGEGFERLEETRVEQERLQLEDDAAFNNDEMAVSIWKDNFRGRQAEFFARRDEIVKDFGLKFGKDKEGVNAAIDSYFSVEGEDYKNLMTGGVDWDRFFAARDATLEGLSPTNLKLVREYLHRYDTPTVREFRQAQSDLDEYWAIEDLVWSRLREKEEFNPFLSLDDYLAFKMQSLLDSGVPPDQASSTLARLAVVNHVTSMVARLRGRYRLSNPDKDALLGKWYGLSPAKPLGAKLEGRRGRRGRGGR